MSLAQFPLFVALPAIVAALLTVGLFGWRVIGLAVAVAAMLPFVLMHNVPPLPWDAFGHGGDTWAWHLWGVVLAGLLGALRDCALLPRAIGELVTIGLLACLPWLLFTELRTSDQVTDQWVVAVLCLTWIFVAVAWVVLRSAMANAAGLGGIAVSVVCLLGDLAWLCMAHAAADSTSAVTTALVLLVAMLAATWRQPFLLGEGACLPILVVHLSAIVALSTSNGGLMGESGVNVHLPLLAVGMVAPLPLWLAVRRVSVRSRTFGNPRHLAIGAAIWGGLWLSPFFFS